MAWAQRPGPKLGYYRLRKKTGQASACFQQARPSFFTRLGVGSKAANQFFPNRNSREAIKLSIRHRLKVGSKANFIRLSLNLSSTLKTQAWLGLDNFWLVPPLDHSRCKIIWKKHHLVFPHCQKMKDVAKMTGLYHFCMKFIQLLLEDNILLHCKHIVLL